MVTEIAAEPRIIAGGFCFTESPHWHDDLLWFSDMHADKVFAIDEHGAIKAAINVPGGPNGIGWLPDGRMLVVSTSRRLIYRLENGEFAVHADLSNIGDSTHPLNDMCVAPDGSCYVGEFGLDIHAWLGENLPKLEGRDITAMRDQPAAEGLLFKVSPEGKISEAASGLRFPNGVTITHDAKLIVAESTGVCLSVFAMQEGQLADRKRVYSDFPPDGVSVPDAEGRIWVADPFGSSVALMSPDGEWILRVHVPRAPYACAVRKGHPDAVYLCTASSVDPQETAAARNGRIELLQLDFAMLGEGDSSFD